MSRGGGALPEEHADRVQSIQQDLRRLRTLSNAHAESVSKQLDDIQTRIAEVMGVNALHMRSTMDSDV